MYLPYAWPRSASGEAEAWENPSIPAGYTYLAQLVAHDTVHSTVPTAALRLSGQTVRNGRSAPLELQTLYGNGFDGCLTAMTAHDREQLTPSKLPLGQIRIGETIDGTCPFRDIPRALSPHTTTSAVGFRNVLIADDRNDNNVLVSQVAMLFALFHNTVVDLLHSGRCVSDAPSLAYFAELYDEARSVCVETYHRIVRNDLLKRLLHPAVYAAYSSAQPRYLDTRPEPVITFEFLQALRFGHAMVRPHYRVNDVLGRREELIDVLLTTSRSRPWRLPLDESWPVQWSKFYPIAGSAPNSSRRIGPCFSPDSGFGARIRPHRRDGRGRPGVPRPGERRGVAHVVGERPVGGVVPQVAGAHSRVALAFGPRIPRGSAHRLAFRANGSHGFDRCRYWRSEPGSAAPPARSHRSCARHAGGTARHPRIDCDR